MLMRALFMGCQLRWCGAGLQSWEYYACSIRNNGMINSTCIIFKRMTFQPRLNPRSPNARVKGKVAEWTQVAARLVDMSSLQTLFVARKPSCAEERPQNTLVDERYCFTHNNNINVRETKRFLEPGHLVCASFAGRSAPLIRETSSLQLDEVI